MKISTWGKLGLGKITVRGTRSDDVVRSLERRHGLQCCGGPRDDGYDVVRGVRVAHHYEVSLGTPCRGGGWSPSGSVWFSIPIRDAE
jgi:hypothetical protein